MSIARTELAETGAAAAEVPYGIWVSADGDSIFISDSGDYINPGTIFALDRELSLTGRFSAGVNPGHFAFLSM